MLRDALEKAWTRPESERREALAALLKTAQVGLRDDMNRRLEKEKNAGLEDMYAHAAGMDALLSDVAAFACETVFSRRKHPKHRFLPPSAVTTRRAGSLFRPSTCCSCCPKAATDVLAEIVSFNPLPALDSGLKVGHAVRTHRRIRPSGSTGHEHRTNLLEARFIWGNEISFSGLCRTL